MITLLDDPDQIDWSAAAEVFRLAPLGTRQPEKLRRTFLNSYACTFAFEGSRLVGLGRALCDGECQAAIYDIVVIVECQGRGIGRAIMRNLMSRLPVDNVILYAVPGKEAFYGKLGFRKMRTALARLGPAMADPELGYLATDVEECL